jgi:hypothetical protein
VAVTVITDCAGKLSPGTAIRRARRFLSSFPWQRRFSSKSHIANVIRGRKIHVATPKKEAPL